jgi:hypothetical protein
MGPMKALPQESSSRFAIVRFRQMLRDPSCQCLVGKICGVTSPKFYSLLGFYAACCRLQRDVSRGLGPVVSSSLRRLSFLNGWQR